MSKTTRTQTGSLRQLLANTTKCPRCDGKGWVGTVTASQFAYIGKLALAGRLPTRTCGPCNGTGLVPKVGKEAVRP